MSKNEIAILGLLAEGPKHGYQIHQDIKRREMDWWAKIKLASIYTTLTRLEEQALIKSEKEKVGNTPERTVYSRRPPGMAVWARCRLHHRRAPRARARRFAGTEGAFEEM